MFKHDSSVKIMNNNGGPVGFVFFAAFMGAAIYFVQNSVGFWGFVLAVLKAFVWPGFVVYHVLQVFKM